MHSFIVLEGLDGCGKSTQIRLLMQAMEKRGIRYQFLHFPRLDSPPYGELISRFLRGEFGKSNEVDPYLVSTLYASDRAGANDMICRWIDEGFTVIVDRYTYSNMAFQAAKVHPPERAERIIRWIEDLEFGYHGIRKPDLSLFLHVPIGFIQNTLSTARRGNDRKYLGTADDIHEKSMELQAGVLQQYLSLCSSREDLVLVECSRDSKILPPQVIHDRILSVLGI